MVILEEPVKFVWDKGNSDKNWLSHQVTQSECEDVFEDQKKRTFKDKVHSGKEERFRVIGKTAAGRLLFIVFTIRLSKIRVISARDSNRKEAPLYEEKINIT